MMFARRSIAGAAMLFAGAAAAQEPFISGIYLASKELCAEAKANSLQTVIEEGNLVLSAKGLQGVEYNCEFLQVLKSRNRPAWAVTALCEEPGSTFPELLSIAESSPGTLSVVSVYGQEDAAEAGSEGEAAASGDDAPASGDNGAGGAGSPAEPDSDGEAADAGDPSAYYLCEGVTLP